MSRERGIQATAARVLLYFRILLLNVSAVSAHRRPYNTQQRKVLMLGKGSGQGWGELMATTASQPPCRARPCHGARSWALGGGDAASLDERRSWGLGWRLLWGRRRRPHLITADATLDFKVLSKRLTPTSLGPASSKGSTGLEDPSRL